MGNPGEIPLQCAALVVVGGRPRPLLGAGGLWDNAVAVSVAAAAAPLLPPPPVDRRQATEDTTVGGGSSSSLIRRDKHPTPITALAPATASLTPEIIFLRLSPEAFPYFIF